MITTMTWKVSQVLIKKLKNPILMFLKSNLSISLTLSFQDLNPQSRRPQGQNLLSKSKIITIFLKMTIILLVSCDMRKIQLINLSS